MTDRSVFKMATVVRRTGFSPAVLRAWERRHGLLHPERTEGGHRLYTADDLRVLESVRDLLGAGRTIGEIARLGRRQLLSALAPRPAEVGGSGNARFASWRRGMVDAAVALDGSRLERTLDETFARVSVSEAIEQVVVPAMEQLGELWRQGRCSVAGEHMASAKVAGRMLKLLQIADRSANTSAPASVAACLPDEQHQLGSLVAAYCLGRYGFRVTYLGPSMPLADLEETCRVLRPDVVCLSVSRESLLRTHQPRLLELVRRSPSSVRFVLGGSGVVGAEQPALAEEGVKVVGTIREFEAVLRDR